MPIEKRIPGYYLDPHVHTRYSREGSNYSPKEAILKAREIGLDGLGIAEHYDIKGARIALDEAAKLGFLIVPCVEYAAFNFSGELPFPFHLAHIVGVGIDPDLVKEDWKELIGRSVDQTVDYIHERKGLAIAAHVQPIPGYSSLSRKEFLSQMASEHPFDGVEAVSARGIYNQLVDDANDHQVPVIGSGDGHTLDQIGGAGIIIPPNIQIGDWHDVVEAIRRKNIQTFRRDLSPEQLRSSKAKFLILQVLASMKRKASR